MNDSDHDISDMINHSDQNILDPVSRDVEGSTGQGQGPVDQGYQTDNSVSQNYINRQMFSQLSNLGARLAVVESSTTCKPNKKTSDVEKVNSSKRVRHSKADIPYSNPNQQQRDAGMGCASNEIPPPINLGKQHI